MTLLAGFKSPRPTAPPAPAEYLPTSRAPAREDGRDMGRVNPSPRQTGPTDAEVAARTALRDAIAALPTLEAAAQEATRRAGRALGLVEAARATVARYDDLDERMKAHDRAALSAHTNTALPPALVAAQRERTEARERLAQAVELHDELSREVDAGTAAIAAGTARVQACAVAVMREMAQQEGERMREAELHAARQRARLVAFTDALGLADRVAGTLPPSLAMMAYDGWHRDFLSMAATDAAAERAVWAELRQRLTTDPDATGVWQATSQVESSA